MLAFLALFLLLCATGHARQTWDRIALPEGPIPVPRINSAAVYDPVRHRMVVIGGRTDGRDLNDVWALDLKGYQWSELTPSSGLAPTPRFTHNAVYDKANHRVLVWAGRQGGTFFNDVWAFDLSGETWTQFAPPDPVPNIRYGTASIFDPLAGDLVSFAGFTDKGRFEDTWRFDAENGAWTEVSPPGGNPGLRCLHAAIYDARDHRMIMYGGQRGGGALADIWAFDLERNSWTELTPSDSPPGRYFTAGVYDARNHCFVAFGGNLGEDEKTSAVWSFDLSDNSWAELQITGDPPAARDGAVAVYVESEDRIVIFGGGAVQGLFNDVWSLSGLTPDPPTAVGEAAALPSGFLLHQNHPNPFNQSTTISYDLVQDTEISLKIHDLLGRQVRTLVHRLQSAGPHSIVWDGRDEQGRQASSGAYFARLQAAQFVQTSKLLLIR